MHIYQRSIIVAQFEWFLEHKVLPRRGQYPALNSILVMDNTFIHYSLVRVLI